MTLCPYAARLPLLLEHQLSEEECREIERHVEACPLCEEELERLTASDGKALPLPPVPVGDATLPVLDTDPELELPAVPGYRILRVVGRGGRGIVYLAEHARLPRRVALKMIRAGSGARPRDLARFRIEAEVLARLRHAHIIPIYEVSDYQGQPFIAMEYADGGTLKDRLKDELPPPMEAARLVETLARAMHYAHQRGVLHRDLTPANVLLAEDGTPKIADFGLAKVKHGCLGGAEIDSMGSDDGLTGHQDAPAEQMPLTHSDVILGTPSYMAPEQAEGKMSEVGTLTDIYALGAILYKTLTGHAPFEGTSRQEIVCKVLSEAVTRPRHWRREIPADLETICLKCLEQEPGRRYASAEQLAEELQRFQRREPLAHTRPVGTRERMWSWCRRNPALALAQAVAALALLGLVAVALWFGVHSTAAAGKLSLALDDSRTTNEKAATVALGNALTLCESGRATEGLLWMAHSLEIASRAETPPLEQMIRRQLAFHQHAFCPLQAVYEHDQKVTAVAVSPDGQVLLIGGAGGTARLWQASTSATVGAPLRHRDPVTAVAFSPDGKVAVTASGERESHLRSREPGAQVWDADTGRLLHTFKHKWGVLTVAFRPDGKQVLTGGWDRCARLWDLATGKEDGEPFRHPGRVVAAAFSPDGKTLVTAWPAPDTQRVRLWDVATRQLLAEHSWRAERTLALALRSDGKALGAARGPEGVQVWEIDGRPDKPEKPVGPRWKRRDSAQVAAFSPEGRMILTGGGDGYARLWDLATGRPVGAPVANPAGVTAAAFGPGGGTFLTGCAAASARLWKRPPGEPVTIHLTPPPVKPYPVTYSPDGSTLLTAEIPMKVWPGNRTTSTLRRWDARTGAPVGQPLEVPELARAAAFHPRRNTVLIGGCAADVRTSRTWAEEWDLGTGRPAGRPLPDGKGVILAVAWSPDGGQVLTGDTLGQVLLREAASGRLIGGPRHKDLITSVSFSPDGQTVLTASRDQTAQLWDLESGGFLELPHDDPVHAVAFAPGGQTVLTGSGDPAGKRGAARRWDTRTGLPLGPPLAHRDAVLAVACSPDGATIVTGGADATARLWDAATGLQLGPPLPHPAAVHAVAFHAQGTNLVTAGGDFVYLWPAPGPLPEGAAEVRVWVETLTGMELLLEGGLRANPLGQAAWQQRRQQLQDLGGRPPP